MAVRSDGFDKWAGLALSSVLALIAGVAFVVRIDTRLSDLEKNTTEIKAVIDTIAPRKVKTEAATAPLSLPSDAAVAGPAPAEQLGVTFAAMTAAAPLPDPNDDTTTWPARYLADHCRRCPSCCVTLSTAALP